MKVTSADVQLNEKFRQGLHRQPLPKRDAEVKTFSQQLIDVVDLMQVEDDLSDAEEAVEQFEDEEGDAED